MERKRYDCVGAVAWVAICLWSGYSFGGLSWVKDHFQMVVLAIVFISVLPMLVELVLAWRQRVVLAKTLQAVQPIPKGQVESLSASRQAS